MAMLQDVEKRMNFTAVFGIIGGRLKVVILFSCYRPEEEATCRSTSCLWPTCPSALFTIPFSLADNWPNLYQILVRVANGYY